MTEEQIRSIRLGEKFRFKSAPVPPGPQPDDPVEYVLEANGLDGLIIRVYQGKDGEWYFSSRGMFHPRRHEQVDANEIPVTGKKYSTSDEMLKGLREYLRFWIGT